MQQYVIDTSVLLSYGTKVFKAFEDEEVIIPLVVVRELENKRNHKELGLTARAVLRLLDDLSEEGDLSQGVLHKDGAIVSVHLNDVFCSELPDTLKDVNSNDIKILSVAKNLDAVLITNDIPLRVQAAVVGVDTERFVDRDYEHTPDISPCTEIWMNTEDINDLYKDGFIVVEDSGGDFPVNTNLIIKDMNDPNHSALAVSSTGWKFKLVDSYEVKVGPSKVVKPRNAMQKFYLEHLLNPEIKVVFSGGVPGGGKTLLAMAAGEALVEDKHYDKMMVFKSTHELSSGRGLGYLPGTEEEKFSGFAASIFDATSVYSKKTDTDRRIENGKLEILPLTHLRGRTLNNAFILVTEAQNLELTTLLTILTRVGRNSKLVFDYDINQRDNLSIGKHQGIYEVIKKFTGNKLAASVVMTSSERSDLAAVAYKLLSDLT